MQIKIYLPGMVVVTSMLLILASGCASSSVEPSSPKAQSSLLAIEQPAITDYMRSQIGTLNDCLRLHPLKPETCEKLAISGCAT